MLTAIKSKLIQRTKLTITTANETLDKNKANRLENITQNDVGQEIKQNIKEMQRELLACLPHDKYNNVVKLLNQQED